MKHTFLVKYYPAIPNQTFTVTNINWFSLNKQNFNELDSYEMGKQFGAMRNKNSNIIAWNNSWFSLIKANSVKEAIDIFYDEFEKED